MPPVEVDVGGDEAIVEALLVAVGSVVVPALT